MRWPLRLHFQGGAWSAWEVVDGLDGEQYMARWKIISGTFNSDRLIDFFEFLIENASRKVLLVLDNPGVHHGKSVRRDWPAYVELMEVFYLPGYSPELNPDERLDAGLGYASTVPSFAPIQMGV